MRYEKLFVVVGLISGIGLIITDVILDSAGLSFYFSLLFYFGLLAHFIHQLAISTKKDPYYQKNGCFYLVFLILLIFIVKYFKT